MYISIWMLIPFLPRFMGFISMRKFGYNYITHIRSMFGGDDVPSTSVLDIVYPHSIFDESFHEISSSDHLELPQPKCINCIFFEPLANASNFLWSISINTLISVFGMRKVYVVRVHCAGQPGIIFKIKMTTNV